MGFYYIIRPGFINIQGEGISLPEGIRPMYWVQVVTCAAYKSLCRMAVCPWEKAHMGSMGSMGSTYDFDFLMYLLANRIGTHGSWDASTMLTCHIYVGVPAILPKLKVLAVVCFSWI